MLIEMDSALLDCRLYLSTLIYAGLSMSLAVISVFLPSIIRVLGYSGAKANPMTVPVYVTSYGCLIISAWISDFTQNRSPPKFAGGGISGTGDLLLGLLHDHYARYASTFLIVVISLTMTPPSSDHNC